MERKTLVRRHPLLVLFVSASFAFILAAALLSKKESSLGVDKAASASEEIRRSYDQDRLRFIDGFSKLESAGPNLRWLPENNLNDRAGEAAELLVVPFGPCAHLVGSTPSGYGLISMKVDPYLPSVPSSLLGTFPTRIEARAVAKRFCTDWYKSELKKPSFTERASHLWFKPEDEQTPVSDNTVPQQQASESIADDVNPPMRPQSLALPREQFFKWKLEANGDEILLGPNGTCATLALASAHDSENVHILFADGTQKIVPLVQSSSAFAIANVYCNAKFNDKETNGVQ